MKKTSAIPEGTAEKRIKEAAKQIFLSKGFGGSRTREIALLAKANPALVNYYFRSKENLFEVVMLEMMGEFMQHIARVVNRTETSFEQKIEDLVMCYVELGRENPSLPLFVLNEMRKGHLGVSKHAKNMKKILQMGIMSKQLEECIKMKKYRKIEIAEVMMSILGYSVFPYIAAPLIQTMGGMNALDFQTIMNHRKKHIADWILHSMKS